VVQVLPVPAVKNVWPLPMFLNAELAHRFRNRNELQAFGPEVEHGIHARGLQINPEF
jgi:hypothetical protein